MINHCVSAQRVFIWGLSSWFLIIFSTVPASFWRTVSVICLMMMGLSHSSWIRTRYYNINTSHTIRQTVCESFKEKTFTCRVLKLHKDLCDDINFCLNLLFKAATVNWFIDRSINKNVFATILINEWLQWFFQQNWRKWCLSLFYMTVNWMSLGFGLGCTDLTFSVRYWFWYLDFGYRSIPSTDTISVFN